MWEEILFQINPASLTCIDTSASTQNQFVLVMKMPVISWVYWSHLSLLWSIFPEHWEDLYTFVRAHYIWWCNFCLWWNSPTCLLLDEQFCVLQMSGPSSVTSLTSRLLDAGKRFVARGLIDRTQHEARLWLTLSVGSRTGIYIAAGLRGDYAAEKRHLNAAIPYFFCNIALLYK